MPVFGKFGPLVGAIDEGTSSARFIIFKANSSEVVAFHQKELEQHFPQEGWVEQDPYAILEVVTTCIEKAIEKLMSVGGSSKVRFNCEFLILYIFLLIKSIIISFGLFISSKHLNILYTIMSM